MLTAEDLIRWAISLRGEPKVVIQPSDPAGPCPGVITFYIHRQHHRRIKKLLSREFQHANRPIAILWQVKYRSHAWLLRLTGNSQCMFYYHDNDLENPDMLVVR